MTVGPAEQLLSEFRLRQNVPRCTPTPVDRKVGP
jgi:hypothetical protein